MDDKTSDEIRNLISFDRKPDNETNSDENPENNIDDIYDENPDLPTDNQTEGESENNTDNTAYESTEDIADNSKEPVDRIEISDDSRYSDAEEMIRLVVSNSEKAAKAAKTRKKSHRNVSKTAKKSNRKTGYKKGSILGKRSKRAGQSFLIREEGSDFVVLNIPFLNFLNHEGEEEYYPELREDYRPPKKKRKKVRRRKRSTAEELSGVSESAEYTRVISDGEDISENNDYTRVTPVIDESDDNADTGGYAKVIPINADNVPKKSAKKSADKSDTASDGSNANASYNNGDSVDNASYDDNVSYDDGSYDEDYEYYDDYEDEDKDRGKRQKNRRPLIIGGAAIVIAAIVFAAVTVIGNRPQSGVFNIFRSSEPPETQEADAEYITETAFSKVIPYEHANDAVYSAYSDGIICAATNQMQYINSNGEVEWETATAVINPLLSVSGKYVLLAEQGGTKICLYEDNKLIYDTRSEDKILSAEVSAGGDSVFVTSKDLFKGAVYALNKNGDVIYSWASGNYNITAATISADSRNIAAALLNTDDTVSSQINIFDITKTDPVASAVFDDTLIYSLCYKGKSIYAFGDNAAVALTGKGEKKFELRFDESELVHSSIADNSDFLLMRDKGNMPSISYYKANGTEKYSTSVSNIADYMLLKDNRILYNSGRDVLLSHTDGRKPYKYTAGMDIHGLIMTDKKEFFIIYSNSVELVKF